MISNFSLANAIRALSLDAVQQAKSGHPGMPLGMADIAQVLWQEFLSHNPANPNWLNRDRFVLSNGHGSMLLYSLLHLSGYDLTIDDIKDFRQMNSKTPGHPEYGHTAGVETTTGPLGQGLANAVGMALAEKLLATSFNTADFNLIDHYTYAFAGDGCLMEGISHEVCSLAGTLGLDKLIVFYDDNGISIDGKVEGWFTDNTAQRFAAYGWHVIENVDGHNSKDISNAIKQARANQDKPSIIICKTHIGYGSPSLQDSEKSHGAPFGEAEIKATKNKLGWAYDAFEIPADIYQAWNAKEQGQALEQKWQALFKEYQTAYPEKAKELLRRINGELPENFNQLSNKLISKLNDAANNDATRKSSEHCLNDLGQCMPELLGGSADLSGSNNTKWSGAKLISKENMQGNYICYGVREFGMSAIMNGLALHGGFIPYGGTFLVFSDYARNAVRLSAMMKQKVIYVYSHDSIGLGEDGPTHQPIEQINMLRGTPDLDVWRPADSVETAVAWQQSILRQGTSCLLLSRQNLSFNKRNAKQQENIARGGYILDDCSESPEVILMATGSEVELAIEAKKQLSNSGLMVRVVSMPCVEVFLRQDINYQQEILPEHVSNRIAIEAGSPDGWYRFTGLKGQVIGLTQFGLSAPYKEIYQQLGLNVENIVKAVLNPCKKIYQQLGLNVENIM